MADRTRCSTCPASAGLARMGLDVGKADYIIVLAGNPNTGKSSVFNALTGLRQHTGNWPGKTVSRAEGGYSFAGKRYKLVDLPGTYSLLSAAQDEEIARDSILFGQPDCTVVITDATCLERNLNLVLQVLEISDRVVVCVNLIDEARRKGLRVDTDILAADLGVPVVATSARTGEGLPLLLETIDRIVQGEVRTSPHHVMRDGAFQRAVSELVPLIEQAVPGLPNARWVAVRLLDGDHHVQQALLSGELADIAARQAEPGRHTSLTISAEPSQ
ncbi:MAG: 50S ribosome-binding GTPase [Phycisphaerales bacterium]|nr:50S ribosome-binding GTPase [Phycisphaerales bacterium]